MGNSLIFFTFSLLAVNLVALVPFGMLRLKCLKWLVKKGYVNKIVAQAEQPIKVKEVPATSVTDNGDQ